MGILSDIVEKKYADGLDGILTSAVEAERKAAAEDRRKAAAIAALDEHLQELSSKISEAVEPRSKLMGLPRFYQLSDLLVVIKPFTSFETYLTQLESGKQPFLELKLELVAFDERAQKLVFTDMGTLSWATRESIVKAALKAFEQYTLDLTDASFTDAIEAYLRLHDREICNKPILVVPKQMRSVIDAEAHKDITIASVNSFGDSRDAIKLCRLDKGHDGSCSVSDPAPQQS